MSEFLGSLNVPDKFLVSLTLVFFYVGVISLTIEGIAPTLSLVTEICCRGAGRLHVTMFVFPVTDFSFFLFFFLFLIDMALQLVNE